MTRYICKCGRVVHKSTNADNTGNRETDGCEGCPYLLPWGPMVWDDQHKAYTQDVKGHECRMSPTLEYTSTYHGRADDKCSLRIVSLDLDFLDEVQAWIYEHAADTLTAGFSRGSIRGIEFSDKGRYSLSVSCAQNKKGMAAKTALIEHFFGPDKHRLDMTPQQEKAHILAAINAGKARVQKGKEKKVKYIISEHQNGLMYAYYKNLFWFWDKGQEKWISSSFAEQRYKQALQKDSKLTPEIFMDSGDFYTLDEYEIPMQRRIALETLTAADCKAAESEASANPILADADVHPCAPTASDVPPSLSQSADADVRQGGEDDTGVITSNVGELIKAGSDDRRRVQSRVVTECGKISALHVCGRKPENMKIWLNAMMPAEYWVMNKLGNPCGEHIEICPYCNADLKNGEGDVMIVPFGYSANFTDAAPASPADAGAATQSLSAADPASLEAESVPAAFDYSGLSGHTVAVLHMAEREIREARQTYICRVSAAVAAAHEAVVANCENGEKGQFASHENTFLAWCASVCLKKDAAYRLLQVNALLTGATPEEQATLEAASPSLLYAAAKPSAPAELVQAVKDGDITTHKQYQELLEKYKAEQQAHRAERESTSALLRDEQQRRQKADEARIMAEKKVQQYLEIKDAALETAKQQRVKAADAEARAIAAEKKARELESRPGEVAVQEPTEEQIAAAAKQRTAMLEAQVRSLQDDKDSALRQLDELGNTAYMAAAEFADNAARTVDSIRTTFWALAKEFTDDDFCNALDPLSEAVRKIYEGEWESET